MLAPAELAEGGELDEGFFGLLGSSPGAFDPTVHQECWHEHAVHSWDNLLEIFDREHGLALFVPEDDLIEPGQGND